MLIHPHLASSWPITPNKSGRLRHSKKSSGGGKGLCLCCRSRALTSGATKPPGRRGCDDLSGAGPMHLKARRAVSFLPCCISCHATLDLQQKHRVLLLQGTVARAEAYHGGEQTARRPNQGPTPRIPKKEDGVKGLRRDLDTTTQRPCLKRQEVAVRGDSNTRREARVLARNPRRGMGCC